MTPHGPSRRETPEGQLARLAAVLPEAAARTGGERRLLAEWLDRLAASRPP